MIDEKEVEVVETPKEVTEEVAPVEPTIEEDGKKGKKKKSKLRSTIEWVVTGLFVALFAFIGIGQIDGMIHKKENCNQSLSYGYGAFVIQTTSMEPVYKKSTAIITHKDSAKSAVDKFNKGGIVDITFAAYYVSNNAIYDYPYYRPGNIEYGGINYHLAGNEPVYPNPNLTPIITHRMIGYYEDSSRQLGRGRYTFVVAGINTEGDYSKEGQYQLLTENELVGIVKVNSSALGKMFMFITTPWGLLVFLLVPAFYLVITSVLDIFKAIKEPEEGETNKGDSTPKGDSPLDSLSDEDRERLKKEMLDEMLNKKGKK